MNDPNLKSLNTPYDSAFKSIIQKCPRLSLFLINEMFYRNQLIPKEYDGTERVTLLNRELTDLEFGNLAEDIRLKVGTDDRDVFHLECESTAGGTRVMLRMVRYDTRSALEDVEVTEGFIRVRIDDSGVFFLRSTKNTPSMVKVILEGPQGSSMSYQIPALKLQDYSMDDMLKKKLFIMLPFLFFNYEKQLEKTADPQVFAEIEKRYDAIIQQLRGLEERGVLNVYEADTLYEALKVVVEALGERCKAEKEVQTIMGGKVLEFRGDKYYNAGKEEGRDEGISQVSSLMSKLFSLGRTKDAEKASNDPVYLQQLMVEFGLA